MSEKNFVDKYLEDFSSLIKPNPEITEKIVKVKNILVEVSRNFMFKKTPASSERIW